MTLVIEAGFDLVDLDGYALAVVETGGNSFNAIMTSGQYFLRSNPVSATGDHAALVTSYLSFTTELQALLNAGGAGASSYTVTMDTTTERVTIEHDGTASVTAVSLTPTTNGGIIGQTGALSGALSHEMQRTPDYWIKGDVGFWSDYHEHEDDSDAAFTHRTHDGRPYGIAKSGVATFLDLTVPLEPRASVYTAYASSSDPWTWQALFRHARNVFVIAIDDGTLIHFTKLRSPVFNPLRRATDYVGHFDIRLETDLLARF